MESKTSIKGKGTLTIDEVIESLLTIAKSGTFTQKFFTENDILTICQNVKNILVSQPILLELEGPLKICGDIHGQFPDLIRLFELCGDPSSTNYLFLGDYVDRGKQSLETICLLYAYKIKFPTTFFLLRGNHESQAISRIYGFFDECKRRYNVKLWRTFLDVFNNMPVAAIIENQIFCCHGGLSPEFLKPDVPDLDNLKKKIKTIPRPTDVPEEGMVCDLVWADPFDSAAMGLIDNFPTALFNDTGFAPNERGVSYVFSPTVVDSFLSRFSFDLIVRAHQVVEDGYEFFANRSFVTIFSAPNYCGEFDNAGGIFCLSRSVTKNSKTNEEEVDLEGSFQILYPETKKRVLKGQSGNRRQK